MLDCTCPLPTALTTVPYARNCAVFGKDARWAFQRRDDANNLFVDATNDIETEASWTALPDAVDGTKVVITPLLEEVDFPEPDILEDSENFDGAPFAVTAGPQKVSGVMRNPSAAQVAALRVLACEENLTLYRIDANGNFGARLVGSDHLGIIISPGTFVLRGPYRGTGRVDVYKVRIEFYLPYNWYDTFDIVAPAAGFDPLTEIAPS